MRKLYILMLFILSAAIVNAAEHEFKVLAVKGDVKVSENGGSWQKLKANSKLDTKDKLKVGSGDYVGLVHKSGFTLEIDKQGEYSARDLSREAEGKNYQLSQKFTDYVIDEISNADDILTSKDYHDNMSLTGSVERGMAVMASKSGTDALNPGKKILIANYPWKTDLLDGDVTLAWLEEPDVNNYKIIITDRYDKVVYFTETSDTFCFLELEEKGLERGNYYFWQVCNAADENQCSMQNAVRILNDSKSIDVKNQLEELKSQLKEESAISWVILAKFYEDHELYADAMRSYQQAVDLRPDAEAYQKLYSIFLYNLTNQ